MATSEKVPPLVDFKVNNPVTYLKLWWERIIGNEGIDIHIRIRPLTTILALVILGSLFLGIGKFVWPEGYKIPFFEFRSTGFSTPTPSPSDVSVWENTAYTGRLQYSEKSNRYYLMTTSSEAITLEVPENLSLETLIGKRIFAVGKYNKKDRLLIVNDVKNLEVLPQTAVPIPTVDPSPLPTPENEKTEQ